MALSYQFDRPQLAGEPHGEEDATPAQLPPPAPSSHYIKMQSGISGRMLVLDDLCGANTLNSFYGGP